MKTIFMCSSLVCLAIVAPAGAEIPRKQDLPRFIKELQSSSNARTRADAAEALGHRGAIKKADVLGAIEPLVKALKDDSAPTVRKAAATALGAIGPDPKVSVPPLIEALQDDSIDVRIAAANALGSFGTDAREAVSALREAKAEAEKGFTKKKGKKSAAERQQRQLARAAGMALRSIMGKPRKK
jgi:HEAT repeat protein